MKREVSEPARAVLLEELKLCDAFAAEAADAETLEQVRQCVISAAGKLSKPPSTPPGSGAAPTGDAGPAGMGTLGTALLVGSGVLVAGAIVLVLAK